MQQPSLFIAGELDPVIGSGGTDGAEATCRAKCEDLRGAVFVW